jgi:putative heme degradation protein
VAHLKLIGMDDAGAFAVGNVVSNDTSAKLSLASNLTLKEAELIVNARVAIDPAVLEAEVKKVVAAECAKAGVKAEFRNSQSLRPGRPVPTYRYAEAKK